LEAHTRYAVPYSGRTSVSARPERGAVVPRRTHMSTTTGAAGATTDTTTTAARPSAEGTAGRTEVQQLADFVAAARYEDLSAEDHELLKVRILYTFGVAIGALDAPPLVAIRELVEDLGGTPQATLIGGGRTAPDRAAFHTSALSRYLDFMDSYLAEGETNHPSDNLGAVLAAVEHVDGTGQKPLTPRAAASQPPPRPTDVAPVRPKGFDHATQGAYAAAASAAKGMRLSAEQIAHAIAISGTANNALRVTRTGNLSHWK